ncbi:PilW family protein [Caldimonas caldifontis]|uniref:Prepilin-type cleavage/methylation domain-containing protein n=1 Tax=Caldimonas caldifontis TaxID=1452508 RepID=A0A2S5SVY8_9BURK|nr:PilW family protein [Caldimonas caldifontis]PPE66886.1 hypothetical protein C1704_05320 [Caldimonas caldifontis]
MKRGIIHRPAAGRSLIEILVSLAIGVVVLGAVLVTVSGTGMTGRKQDAQAQLAEEGQVALNLIAGQLRMAGFAAPRINPEPTAPLAARFDGAPLKGCSDGFTDVAANFDALTCGGGTAHALSIRYEGDIFNTVPAGGNPTDCLGTQLNVLTPSALPGEPPFILVDNRFFIRDNPQTGNPALYCRGSGGAAPQVLVDNVEDMQVLYGVMAPTRDALDNAAWEGSTVRYLTAEQLEAAFPAPNPLPARCSVSSGEQPDPWCHVTSVRVCLLMRSADNAADEPMSFQNCEGDVEGAADRRIRRAMSTTVSLRNRITVAP